MMYYKQIQYPTNRNAANRNLARRAMVGSRRGVTLLFVISTIVLFLLLSASFLLMSGQFRRSVISESRIETRRDDSRTLVNRAFYDLFREPLLDNRFSPLRGHSILGDMYGYGAVLDRITLGVDPVTTVAVVPNSGNQLIDLTLQNQFENILYRDNADRLGNFSLLADTYNGMLLTYITVDGEIVTCRIVDYENNVFRVVLGTNGLGAYKSPSANRIQKVVINNRAFAGTGAGVIANAPVDQSAINGENSPNRIGQSRIDFVNNYSARNGNPNPRSTNEDYDALDVQNMFLAKPEIVLAGPTLSYTSANAFRSFHRNGTIGPLFDVAGSGNPIIDNDGDGVDDGFWMDVDLPLQTDMQGRVFKPLVSYLVLDMDGRLNVNAHGNYAQIPANAQFKTALPLLFGGTSISTGQGFGPHEINLLPLLPVAEVFALMQGNGTWVGRYGVDQAPGAALRDNASALKLFSHPVGDFATRGLTGNFFGSPMDIHGRLGFGSADTYTATLPTDPYNPTGPTVQIPIGLPVADIQTSTLFDEIRNSHLEMDFGKSPFSPAGTSLDTPFTPAELESMLRMYDFDSQMLPQRMRQILANSLSFTSPNVNVVRHLLTTDSFEVPVPPQSLVEKLQGILRTPFPVDADLNAQVALMLGPDIRLGLRMDINRPFGNGVDDGVDSAAPPRRAGVIDEFGEAIVDPGETFPDPYGRAAFYLDADNDGTVGASGTDDFARYHFARHLYIVTLLTTQWFDRDGNGIVDRFDWYNYDEIPAPGPAPPDEPTTEDLYAYRRDVAQWVANVVDYRDPDSIMSVFEFDLDPWDGWDVDGNPASVETLANPLDRFVVVGCERPELLLTECFAAHMRKTEDRNDEVPDPSTDSPEFVADGDPDRDQRFVPTTAFYLELYNPYTRTGNAVINRNNDVLPAELYGNTGVDLRRMSQDGTTPVWRLRVVKSTANYHNTAQLNIDNLTLNPGMAPPLGPNPFAANDVVRMVYFQPPTNAALLAEFPTRTYFPDTALTIPEIAPGGYAVVGSSGVQTGGNYRTYFGRRTTPTWAMELGDTRHINLIPGASQVQIRYWNTTNSTWQTSFRRAVAVPIGRRYDALLPGGEPRSLGLSDPVLGYAYGTYTLSPVADGFEYFDSDPGVNMPVTLDIPTDISQQTDNEWVSIPNTKNLAVGLRDDGLISGAYVVHLQRLANPLRPYDQQSNPYITVDALGVDLNVFNGLSTDPEPGVTAGALDEYFASFERGTNETDPALNYPGTANDSLTFWRHDQSGRITVPGTVIPPLATAGDDHFYSFNLINSFGQIDQAYRLDYTAGNPGIPWLMWNNRPYASNLELANVPYTAPYLLTSRFGVHIGTRDPYAGQRPTDIAAPYNATQFPLQSGQFNHLFGFHTDSISNNPAAISGAPSLHKIFDYVEVPSRFVGTETYFNPAVFAAVPGAPVPGAGGQLGFNAPFGFPSFRYPGKINLNTADETAYQGLMGTNYATIVPYIQFDTSRRLNPFRAAENANLVGATFAGEIRTSATNLFRPDGVGSSTPMFDLQATAAGVGAHNTPDRSAYFRHDMRQRLGNLVTYRSSVFAIWVTVGFFEVDPTTLQPQINREVGREEGQIQRYRGFYLVDRSIPVAFEPGFNHNVDQAIISSSITEHAINRD